MRTSSITHSPASYAVVAVFAAGAMTLSLPMSTSPGTSAAPDTHNARVADYLLFQSLDWSAQNARVAEYRLAQSLHTSR